VLLEVAYFKRDSIRATSRKLGVSTEASYRFERGVDIQNLQRASDRATALIEQLAGGQKAEFYDLYLQRRILSTIVATDLPSSVRRLTGLEVSTDDAQTILNRLGIESSAEDAAAYTAPSWRHDIAIEEDLVEEIARHTGYEKIGSELPPAFGAGEYQASEQRKRRLRQVLVDLGFDEAISYSFIDQSNDQIFEPVFGDTCYVELQDSVIEGAIRMRPTLLPGLIDAVRLNFNHQNRNIRLFEVGKVFAAGDAEDGLPVETELLGLVVTGNEIGEGRSATGRILDLFDAKGYLESALAAAGIPGLEFAPAEVRHLRKGQTAKISHKGRPIGSIGRLDDKIASHYKFKQPLYVGEIDLGYLLALEGQTSLYQPLGRFPAVTRDVSVIVPRSLGWAAIKNSVEAQHFDLCRSVEFVDAFEGGNMSEHERSVTLRLEYRSDERTLVEAEVETVHNAILAGLERDLGIKSRF
jgi:phenylalanyl-tRNA synthetase beta chain